MPLLHPFHFKAESAKLFSERCLPRHFSETSMDEDTWAFTSNTPFHCSHRWGSFLHASSSPLLLALHNAGVGMIPSLFALSRRIFTPQLSFLLTKQYEFYCLLTILPALSCTHFSSSIFIFFLNAWCLNQTYYSTWDLKGWQKNGKITLHEG